MDTTADMSSSSSNLQDTSGAIASTLPPLTLSPDSSSSSCTPVDEMTPASSPSLNLIAPFAFSPVQPSANRQSTLEPPLCDTTPPPSPASDQELQRSVGVAGTDTAASPEETAGPDSCSQGVDAVSVRAADDVCGRSDVIGSEAVTTSRHCTQHEERVSPVMTLRAHTRGSSAVPDHLSDETSASSLDVDAVPASPLADDTHTDVGMATSQADCTVVHRVSPPLPRDRPQADGSSAAVVVNLGEVWDCFDVASDDSQEEPEDSKLFVVKDELEEPGTPLVSYMCGDMLATDPLEEHSCGWCGADFLSAAEMEAHSLRHAEPEDGDPVLCSVETNPADGNSVEHNPTEGSSVEHNPAEISSVEHNPAEGSSVEHNPAEISSVEHNPAEGSSVEHNPAEGSSVEHNPAEGSSVEHNPAEISSVETNPAKPGPDHCGPSEGSSTESNPSATSPLDGGCTDSSSAVISSSDCSSATCMPADPNVVAATNEILVRVPDGGLRIVRVPASDAAANVTVMPVATPLRTYARTPTDAAGPRGSAVPAVIASRRLSPRKLGPHKKSQGLLRVVLFKPHSAANVPEKEAASLPSPIPSRPAAQVSQLPAPQSDWDCDPSIYEAIGSPLAERFSWPASEKVGCGECSMRLESRDQLARHRLGRHVSETWQRCLEPGCSAAFYSKLRLRVHAFFGHGALSGQCSQCAERFPSELLAKAHESVVHGTPTSLACPLCPSEWSSPAELSAHWGAGHQGQTPLHCSLCGLSTANVLAMLRHHQGHVLELRRLHCPACPAWFPTRELLLAHVRFWHAKGSEYACPACPKTETTPLGMERHVQVAHPGQKPYACEGCSSTFKTWNELRVHAQSMLHLVNFPEKLYQCRNCQFKTYDLLQLDEHNETTHMSLLPLDRLTQLMTLMKDVKLISSAHQKGSREEKDLSQRKP